jgi:hypothetical protein
MLAIRQVTNCGHCKSMDFHALQATVSMVTKLPARAQVRSDAPSPVLASWLRCDMWNDPRTQKMATADDSVLPIECHFKLVRHFRRTRRKLNVRANNGPKEANDHGTISDREVWFAIRYLDPESDHRKSNIAAAVALLAVVCIVCVVFGWLHFLGL